MSTGVGMGSCCMSGHIASGTPKGREETIAGLPTYVAEPPNGDKSKSVVFISDIFGYKLNNVRLLADEYAAHGFTAYIPDVLGGDALDESLLKSIEPTLPERESMSITDKATATAKVGASFGPFLIKHREAVARPLIEGFISHVRQVPGTDKVGALGFCWGGRYAILAAQKPFSGLAGKGVDAAFAAHPSLVAIPADFNPVAVPLGLALGEKDSLLGESGQGQIMRAMAAKKKGEGEGEKVEHTEVKIYPGQIHGFALRGDWADEKSKKAIDAVTKQGVEWFRKYL
ncbi:dienelactone hydrolase family protein-like protein [Teratosphaeria nubilosa]|uniref:Dienelactone hydrolase family protein-like protein n=1 Tax=Teratosphaeria nubilosa TaxID=161662 RepID=A0A6G1LB68_9PEZI|nr:dienelactone hydrolase family protein-like protein [Teratosphaeria nubilosa]